MVDWTGQGNVVASMPTKTKILKHCSDSLPGTCSWSLHRNGTQFSILQTGSNWIGYIYGPESDHASGCWTEIWGIPGPIPSSVFPASQCRRWSSINIRYRGGHIWIVLVQRSGRSIDLDGQSMQAIPRVSDITFGTWPVSLWLAQPNPGYQCRETCASMGMLVEPWFDGIIWARTGQGKLGNRQSL